MAFSDDAKSMTDGWNMSLDGGVSWSLIPEYPQVGSDYANKIEYISNDGKKNNSYTTACFSGRLAWTNAYVD